MSGGRLPAAAGLLLALGGAAGAQEIPADPRRLELPEARLGLPAVDGHRFRLDAGPTVVVFEDRSLPLVDVAVALPVGSHLDPPGRAGTALAAGLMLRRGGSAALDPRAFDRRVERLGAEIDVRVFAEHAGAGLSVPSESFAEAWELFFDMLRRPRFDRGELERLRQDLLQSLRRRNAEPADVAEREWHWQLFGRDHYSGRPPTPESLAAVGRPELEAFHRRHIRPGSMVVAVSGDVETGPLLELLERDFTAWGDDLAGVGAAEAAVPWPPAPSTHAPRPGLYLVDRPLPQAKLVLGHRADAGRGAPLERRAALRLALEVLGGSGSISRLGGRLRSVEGLVYRVSASAGLEPPAPAALRIAFDVQPTAAAQALGLVREELARLRREPPHPRELEAARRNLLGLLRLDFDTAEKIAGRYAEDALLGRPADHWRRWVEALEAVGPRQALDAARRLVEPERLVVVVVGPEADLLGPVFEGRTALERAAGLPLTRLPRRDPMTLEPRDEEPQPQGIGSADSDS